MYLENDAGGVTAMWLAPKGDSGDPQNPLVSPLYADLAGLPPLYIEARAVREDRGCAS